MKKILYNTIILAVVALFSSCNQQDALPYEQEYDAKKYEVEFVVNNVHVEYGELKSIKTTNLVSDKIKQIEYWVYKTSEVADMLFQEKPESSYPMPLFTNVLRGNELNQNIKLELAAGSYTVIFFAQDKENTPSTAPAYAIKIPSPNAQTEAFSARIELNVEEGTSTIISKEITLKRKVGQINFVMQDLDKMPSNVTLITPDLHGTRWPLGGYSRSLTPKYIDLASVGLSSKFVAPMAGASPVVVSPLFRENFSAHNNSNPLSYYSIPTFDYLISGYDLYLHGYDTSTTPYTLVFERLIKKGFALGANQKITFTGKIGAIEGGVNIILDDNWSEYEDYEVGQ